MVLYNPGFRRCFPYSRRKRSRLRIDVPPDAAPPPKTSRRMLCLRKQRRLTLYRRMSPVLFCVLSFSAAAASAALRFSSAFLAASWIISSRLEISSFFELIVSVRAVCCDSYSASVFFSDSSSPSQALTGDPRSL